MDLIQYLTCKEIKDQTMESINIAIEELGRAYHEALRLRDKLKNHESLENE